MFHCLILSFPNLLTTLSGLSSMIFFVSRKSLIYLSVLPQKVYVILYPCISCVTRAVFYKVCDNIIIPYFVQFDLTKYVFDSYVACDDFVNKNCISFHIYFTQIGHLFFCLPVSEIGRCKAECSQSYLSALYHRLFIRS